MGRLTSRAPAVRLDLTDPARPALARRPETLAVEEPMELRVDGTSLAVTMRTPGDDFDLALGWLLSEGVIHAAHQVRTMVHCADARPGGSPTYNVVDLALREPRELRARAFAATSACGVCGTSSVDRVRTGSRYDVAADDVVLDPAVLLALPAMLAGGQKVFGRTGGTHAAALFTASGELLCVREDVGRHNAVDKVVGWAMREDRLPLAGHVLLVSSRASFELTQKAALAGIPVLAAVSAASSLAVDLAHELGLTLVGFLRPPRLTVYAGAHRLDVPPTGPQAT